MPSFGEASEGQLPPFVTDRKGKNRASQEPPAGESIIVPQNALRDVLDHMLAQYEALVPTRSPEDNARALAQIRTMADKFGLEFDPETFIPTPEMLGEEREQDQQEEEEDSDAQDAQEVERGISVEEVLNKTRNERLDRAGLLGNDEQRMHAERAAQETQRVPLSSSRKWSSQPAGGTGVPPPYMRPTTAPAMQAGVPEPVQVPLAAPVPQYPTLPFPHQATPPEESTQSSHLSPTVSDPTTMTASRPHTAASSTHQFQPTMNQPQPSTGRMPTPGQPMGGPAMNRAPRPSRVHYASTPATVIPTGSSYGSPSYASNYQQSRVPSPQGPRPMPTRPLPPRPAHQTRQSNVQYGTIPPNMTTASQAQTAYNPPTQAMPSYMFQYQSQPQYWRNSFVPPAPTTAGAAQQFATAMSASAYSTAMPMAMTGPNAGTTVNTLNIRDSIGLANVLRMIQDNVGQPPTGPIPDYLRHAKLAQPPTYDGKDDDTEFNIWLSKLLTYCRQLNLTGPDFDGNRMDVLSAALAGDAASWHFQNVQSPFRTQQYWSFEEIVVAIYKRFILTDAFQQASYEFQKVVYDPDRGVGGLYQDLCHWAQRMLDKPSETVFKDKFLASIPSSLEHEIVISRGVDRVAISSRDLYSLALKIEDELAGMALRRKTYKSANSQSSHNGQKNAVVKTVSSSTTTTNKGSTPRRSYFRPIKKEDAANIKQPIYSKKTTWTRTNPSDQRSRPSAFRPKQTNSAKPSTSTAPMGSKGPCYACGQMGHFANDPRCPKFGQQHKGRMQVGILMESSPGDMDSHPQEAGSEMAGAGNTAPDPEPPQSDYEDHIGYDSDQEEVIEDESDEHLYVMQYAALRVDPDTEKTPEQLEEQRKDELYFAAAKVVQSFQTLDDPPSKSVRTAWLYDSRVRKLQDPKDQPVRNKALQRPLCAEVVINGVPAYTLFDSGCTTDSISPTLAFVTKADCIELSEQMNLQLGAKGSRTKINHGAKANMKIGTVDEDHYFDVVDIDRYDVILGTPFFLEHNVTLDFGNRTITIDGHEVPVYTRIDEATLLTNRKTKTRTKVGKELQAALAEHINKD